jgi:hypothetical protein
MQIRLDSLNFTWLLPAPGKIYTALSAAGQAR